MRSPRSSSTTRRDVGQLQGARLRDRVPLQVGQLAVGNRDLVNDGAGRNAKEARVEASRPPGRRDRAREKRQLTEHRAIAQRKELLPDERFGRRSAFRRRCRSPGPPPRTFRARQPAPAPAPASGWACRACPPSASRRLPGVQILAHGDVAVRGVDASAREHVPSRHEDQVGPPAARAIRAARREESSTTISVAASRGRSVLRGLRHICWGRTHSVIGGS